MNKKINKKIMGEMIFGIHPIIELLRAKQRKLIALYTTKPEPKSFIEIKKHLPSYPIRTLYITRDALTRMAQSTDHQGFVALVQPFPYRKKPFDPKKNTLLLMLDGIQDPRNLGAILRSAYCTGVDGIILSKKQSAPLNAVALKASAGLAEHLAISIAPTIQKAAEELKKSGYNIFLAAFNGQDARNCVFTQPSCIVIGNEAIGISKSLYKLGTQVTLPQRTSNISYNASVAAGLLLFLASSQHNKI